MFEKFIEFINLHKLVENNEKIILGVSGGIDSICMLNLFKQTKINIAIAHCNFSLRGKESDDDERFVKSLSQNMPFYNIRFNTKKYAKEHNISIQMAARDLRYNWFESLLNNEDYSRIAVAHNKNDIVETFFINLIRGTGIKGLTGIQPSVGNLIRPMLFAERNEIDEFISLNNIYYREDSSNANTKYTRNKIRHKILPVLKEINPNITDTIIEDISRLNETELIYRGKIDEIIKKIVRNENNKLLIDINKLSKFSFIKSILYEILYPYGYNSKMITDIFHSINNESGKKFYSESHRLIKDRNYLILTKSIIIKNKIWEISENEIEIKDPLKLKFETISINEQRFSISKNPLTASIDYDKIQYPLYIRKWEKGDHFQPLGMSNFKKLSDFFTDNKFSIDQKENTWLLCSSNDIIWVIGYRIDDRYKTTKQTRKILFINYDT